MLTSSWGSWSTTTTLMRQTNTVRNAECGMRSVKVGVARRTTLPCNSAFRTPHSAFDSSHQLQHPEPLRILPVSTQPHPAVAAAPHELPRPADPAGKHLVDDEVEPYAPADVRAMPFRPRDGERDAIALARPAPRAPDGVGHPGRLPRPASAQPRAILPFGDHEVEAERLARVEPGDRAVERRRLAHAERRADCPSRPVELEQRRERRLGLPRAAESHPSGASVDLPAARRGGVSVRPIPGLDLDHAALRPHGAHDGALADRLEHGHEPRAPPAGASQVEHRPRPAPR